MSSFFSRLPQLCRGDSQAILHWLSEEDLQWIAYCGGVIALGTGIYGATIGLWRGALMALFVAIKFPLLIFLTTLCNGLLNWMLAQVLGIKISFRQTLLAQWMSYTIAALILAALAPITLFILFNTPPLSSGNRFGHDLFILINVGILGGAGCIANIRLYQFLRAKIGNRKQTYRILVAWLAGNLLVGAQLSWNLRPFIGSPSLEIQFLRDDPFNGNFYESVFQTTKRITSSNPSDQKSQL